MVKKPEVDILVRSWPDVAKEVCSFYHTIKLPDELVTSWWDLRGRMPEYIGGVDVSGKRCLVT